LDKITAGILAERDRVARFHLYCASIACYFPDPNGGPFQSRPESKTSGDGVYLEASMGNKLYVGNLSYSVTASQLETLFAAHGTVVSAQVISDRDSGRSKGFGFVEMGSDQEAQAAIAALHGKDMEGRALTVNEAKPRVDRPPGGGGGGGRRGGGGGQGRP
jgi:RNA recognition motif-containing protein